MSPEKNCLQINHFRVSAETTTKTLGGKSHAKIFRIQRAYLREIPLLFSSFCASERLLSLRIRHFSSYSPVPSESCSFIAYNPSSSVFQTFSSTHSRLKMTELLHVSQAIGSHRKYIVFEYLFVCLPNVLLSSTGYAFERKRICHLSLMEEKRRNSSRV